MEIEADIIVISPGREERTEECKAGVVKSRAECYRVGEKNLFNDCWSCGESGERQVNGSQSVRQIENKVNLPRQAWTRRADKERASGLTPLRGF